MVVVQELVVHSLGGVVKDVGADGQRNLVGDVGSRQRWNCVGVVDLGEARWHHWRTHGEPHRAYCCFLGHPASPHLL